MRTRLGFAKSDLSGDGARASGRPEKGASTVAGRAPSAAGAPPPEELTPGPAPPLRPSLPEAPAPELSDPPLHTGKSNFPARAGFWGRRDDNGEMVPLTDPGILARSFHRRAQLVRALRGLLVVLLSAAAGFLAVYIVLELRQRRAVPPAPAVLTAPAPVPFAPAPVPAEAAAATRAEPPRPRLRKRPVPRPRSPRDEAVLRPERL